MTGITVIILTYNESIHIERAIQSVLPIASIVIIVDSYSTDDTCEKAKELGAVVYQHPFKNQAEQINWAVDNIDITTPWIFRLDADEYITPALASEIQNRIPKLDQGINGVVLRRRMMFLGRWLRYGGMYPVPILRIWRKGFAYTEPRWMDEQIVLRSGKTIEFEHDFADENLRSLTWWTEKHNQYATREAIEILNQKYHFLNESTSTTINSGKDTDQRRWLKQNVFMRMPALFRASAFFFLRYFLKGGFLDGRPGFVWHTLQGFWYRYLIDAKVYQIQRWSATEEISIKQTLNKYYPDLYKQLFSGPN